MCVRSRTCEKAHLRSGSRYIYLTDRYICISLLGAAAEDDSVKPSLGNIRSPALQTVGSQPMAEKCEWAKLGGG